MTEQHNYYMKQIDLACLDALANCERGIDASEYGLCLRFAWSVGNWRTYVSFTVETFGGLTFDQGPLS